MGEDDIGPPDGEALGQHTFQRLRTRLVHQRMLYAALGAVLEKARPVGPPPGAAAGAELHGHLVHPALLKPEHGYSSISSRAELRALPCLSMARLRSTPPPRA